MPDAIVATGRNRSAIAWLGGADSEIEPLAASASDLRRYNLGSVAEARSTALRLAREHDGLAIVEASCPAFMAVCRILARSPRIRLVTVHPTTRCMASITIPPPMFHCA